MNYVALGTALLLSGIVIFNASTPQTRKEDVVEDLQVQGQGLLITNFLFVMVWLFAYPAYIKFPGREMRDFYPVFSIFNAWMGLIILIFLGLSSKRFRHVLSVACTKKKQPEAVYVPTDESPIVPLEQAPAASTPVASRPASSTSTTSADRLTSATDLPGATDLEDLEEEEVEGEETKEEEEEEKPDTA